MINSQVNVKKLEKLRLIKTHFPLHRIWEIERSIYLPQELLLPDQSTEDLTTLKAMWKPSLFSVHLPLDAIRHYFGEKVGFYFLYLHTYTLWIIGLAIIGFLYFLATVTQLDKISSFEDEELYCFLTIAWSSCFLEMWKRTQEKHAIQWGQTSFEEAEIQRPEFKGKLRRSPINDGMYELHYAPGKRLIFQLLGFLLSLVFVGFTVAAIASILYKRYKVREAGGIMFLHYDLSGMIFGFMSAIQIQIFNKVFELLAYWTTDLENYRVQSDFENTFIVKCIMFQMVNSYASIVYVAFFQTRFEGCYALHYDGTKEPRSCMYDLQIQLATIYLAHFAKNIILMAGAEFNRWKRKRDSRRVVWQQELYNPVTLRTQLEREVSKSAYIARGIDGTFEDYLELMTQYGYVTMFAVAFPLAPMLACLNNMLGLRKDRFKLLALTRRPVPAGARGIGRWLTVLDLMTNMSIFTNSALLCFTLEAFLDWKVLPDKPLIWFAIMLVGIYLMRKGVAWMIPDVPQRYALVKKRHDVIVERHIKKYAPNRRGINIDSEWVDMTIIGTKQREAPDK